MFAHKSPVDTVILCKYISFPAAIAFRRHTSACIKSPIYLLKLHVSLIMFVIQYVFGDIITRRIHLLTCHLHVITCHRHLHAI